MSQTLIPSTTSEVIATKDDSDGHELSGEPRHVNQPDSLTNPNLHILPAKEFHPCSKCPHAFRQWIFFARSVGIFLMLSRHTRKHIPGTKVTYQGTSKPQRLTTMISRNSRLMKGTQMFCSTVKYGLGHPR
jgi:hypothetical protein